MNADPTALLWLGVLAIGAYHGLNPAMGWPLAVASGLTQRRGRAVWATFVPLGLGHLLAMSVVLVPFALLGWMATWQREIRLAASLLVMAFGLWRWCVRRHPRWLMRIPPGQLLLWSSLMATAHGAALMLLPLVMGLCRSPSTAAAPWTHDGMMALMTTSLGTAIVVSLLHAAAMITAGLSAAWLVYRHFGLQVLRSTWLNLDRIWAASLIASGAAGAWMAMSA